MHMKFFIRMSLGKIHIFGLYIPSQKIQTASHKYKKASSEHFATIDAPPSSCSHVTKGYKALRSKSTARQESKSGGIDGVKEPKDATCKQATTMQDVR